LKTEESHVFDLVGQTVPLVALDIELGAADEVLLDHPKSQVNAWFVVDGAVVDSVYLVVLGVARHQQHLSVLQLDLALLLSVLPRYFEHT